MPAFFLPRCTALAGLMALSLSAADTRLVRETEALTPDEERAALHVPEGFEIQLFASEPMINKPINMAFDAKGRLWVSSTVEYPYCADKNRWSDARGTRVKDSRDAIKILEDTDGDGKADKVTDFADGLNIPTGVVPWHKPEHKDGCIAWSIPNIWYFADTDGDGKADLREVLFGPLGYEKDTHGMCSSFRLGLDGWIYATHGFNNTSHFKVRATTTENTKHTENQNSVSSESSVVGKELDLHSGNVFRFRPDGSRVEPWTHGQVNPFGLCWDRYGNLYSADCHSAPIYQLIRGAHYPSFAKPHDGLGFAPVMCEHTHGSTGICGIAYIDGGVWGPEWDDHMFVGNVVTSKVNHDHVTFTGSTPKANEKPDFITSDDPWFRPVDLQLGPDNALYIADFYNRVIGHYEVPLDHPGRDKERGRIWRVVKRDSLQPKTDLTEMKPAALAQEMDNPNLTRRMLALGQVKLRGTPEWAQTFLDFMGHDGEGPLRPRGDAAPENWIAGDTVPHDARSSFFPQRMTLGTAYALWACSYLGERSVISGTLRGLHEGGVFVVDQKAEEKGVKDLPLGLIMAHATRILGSYDSLHPWEMAWMSLIFDCRGWPAERAAAEVLLNRPDYLKGNRHTPNYFGMCEVRQALRLYEMMSSPPANPEQPDPWENNGDLQMIHALRVLIRDFLSQPGVLSDPLIREAVDQAFPQPGFRLKLLEIMAAVPTPEAAAFLLANSSPSTSPITWTHIARYGTPDEMTKVIQTARSQARTPQAAVETLQALHEGFSERGASDPPELLTWAQEFANRFLRDAAQQPAPSWEPVPQMAPEPAWALVKRQCADGTEAMVLQSMDKGGEEERRTGKLRSRAFTVPAKLSFWINGHRGVPKSPPHDKNLVRLVNAASGEVLASAWPPRRDMGEHVEWDLSKHAGKQARLEIVDGDEGRAYAWIGLTRIEPPVVSVEDFQKDDQTRNALRSLAVLLQHSAPAALREKLAAYLPMRPAPPPLPVSPKQRQQLDALIVARSQAFAQAKADLVQGEKVFTTNCSACHQIGGKGGLIGPQLDGIGNRGVARLCEDILDPNRNVDAHFHLHTLTLKDGGTMSGFLKAEAGQVLILADAAGQEHRVSKTDLAKDDVMPMSLMPPVFGQTVSEKDFLNLIGWLLGK